MAQFFSPLLSSTPAPGRRTGLRSLRNLQKQRAALRGLSPEALEDIGVSRNEAMAEAGRPFWDVPRHWRG